jgi:hypothetical protein
VTTALTDNVEAIITGEEGFEGGKEEQNDRWMDGWMGSGARVSETQESDSHRTKP